MKEYKALTEISAIQYCENLGFFHTGGKLKCVEIGDGNLNLVFRILDESENRSVIVKQALPYARIVGDVMPLTLDRARIEADALRIQGKYCNDMVPEVYHFDKDLAVTVMEDLREYEVMRKGLIQSTIYPKFAQDIALFLARTLFYTSDFCMLEDTKKKLVAQFINPELCKITEDLVFTEPYFDVPNNHYDIEIIETVMELRQDADLLREVFGLKYKFMTEAQALVHGDLHTGSIMVRQDRLKVFDPEFSFYGPMGFDIGAIIANLLLSYAAHRYEENQDLFLEWILSSIAKLWLHFEVEFRVLFQSCHNKKFSEFLHIENDILTALLRDSLGFAGCKMIRRVIGLAHVADLDQILNKTIKNKAEILSLHIGRDLIKQRGSIQGMDGLVSLVKLEQ